MLIYFEMKNKLNVSIFLSSFHNAKHTSSEDFRDKFDKTLEYLFNVSILALLTMKFKKTLKEVPNDNCHD